MSFSERFIAQKGDEIKIPEESEGVKSENNKGNKSNPESSNDGTQEFQYNPETDKFVQIQAQEINAKKLEGSPDKELAMRFDEIFPPPSKSKEGSETITAGIEGTSSEVQYS